MLHWRVESADRFVVAWTAVHQRTCVGRISVLIIIDCIELRWFCSPFEGLSPWLRPSHIL